MRISWKWLSELVDLTPVRSPEALAELLTSRGLEVEAVEHQGQGLEKVITAQILERNPHPQADRLSLCIVSTGRGEPLEIVCGAQNMKAGDRVALAQVGASLPNGVKIAESKIRGVVSHGMLCSHEELGLSERAPEDQKSGIMILPPKTELGLPLAQVLGLDDTVLVFKLTANRGDCLSHWGMAREVRAATGSSLKKPKIATAPKAKTPISITLDAGDSVPQFWGCTIEGVRIGPSPEWVKNRLETLGSRSINNVVDATNLVMLELGHPTHAYDVEKIQGNEIRACVAKKGEMLKLLDETTIELTGNELVIADRERALGLAGVMGGGTSEISDSTNQVFLECAEFHPSWIRQAAVKHQKKTEASHRFERGIDPEDSEFVVLRLASLICELAGGHVSGMSFKKTPREMKSISVSSEYFSEFLGMDIPSQRAESILTGLDCQVKTAGTKSGWLVTPPSYRRDLLLKEDLAEEVARSAGYDKIRETIPPLTSAPRALESSPHYLRAKQIDRAKDALAAFGINEAVHFAFTSRSRLSQFDMTSSVPLLNPLSEEFEVLVPSLLPGLIHAALENWNHHFGPEPLPIRFFEIRPTFSAPERIAAQEPSQTGVQEKWKLAVLLSGPRYEQALKQEKGEVDFHDLKACIESLFLKLGTKGIRFQASENPLFHPGQSASLWIGKDLAGDFGLIHPKFNQTFKLRAPLWIGELDWDLITKMSQSPVKTKAFKNWPQFPAIERDFALVVQEGVSADKITQLALKAGKPLAKAAKIFDVYRGTQVAEGMTSVAVRVIFYEETRSLLESEAEASSAKILDVWKKELGAELRS